MSLRLGSKPDAIRGSERVEMAEERYKAGYATGVCDFIRTAYPEVFEREFGGDYARCVFEVSAAGDEFFDKWKVRYASGLVTRIKLAASGAQ